jgi:hypothetical protein
MKTIKYILLLFLLFSCGSKKSSLKENIEITKEISSNEAENIFKDSITFQNWKLMEKIDIDLSSIDPSKPSTVQFDKDKNIVKFQNAKINFSKIKESDSIIIEDRSTSKIRKKEKAVTTNIISDLEQTKDKKQYKISFWTFLPLLLILGVAYTIYRHKSIIINWIKNNF